MKDDDVTTGPMTEERVKTIRENSSVFKVGVFDPVVLGKFIQLVKKHPEAKKNDVVLIATHHNLFDFGSLIAEIQSDPKVYITVAGREIIPAEKIHKVNKSGTE